MPAEGSNSAREADVKHEHADELVLAASRHRPLVEVGGHETREPAGVTGAAPAPPAPQPAAVWVAEVHIPYIR
jgi:hypothetical protein